MNQPSSFLKQDPRNFQIITLLSFLLIGNFFLGFDQDLLYILAVFTGAFSAQALFTKLYGLSYSWKSPLITGCSLSILLYSNQFYIGLAAGILAISSKFLITSGKRHIFNPANFAIIVLLLLQNFINYSVWISPGQWGRTAILIFLILMLALAVLNSGTLKIMPFSFILIWATLLFSRAIYLGDPLAIPLHQLSNGALLIFTFFMISDPKTIPDHHLLKVLHALTIALLSYYLLFEQYLSNALFYSLFLLSVLVPFYNHFFKAKHYVWKTNS